MLTTLKTEKEKQEALSSYVSQIQANGNRGWDIVKIGNGRKYKNSDGRESTTKVEKKANQIFINFWESLEGMDPEAIKRIIEERLEKINKNPPSQTNQ